MRMDNNPSFQYVCGNNPKEKDPAMSFHDWASKCYLIGICALTYLVTASLACAAEPKFGVIDMRTVVMTSKRAKQAEANVRQTQQELESKISLVTASITALEQKLENEKATLSETQKTELTTQIKMKREELELEKQAGQFKVKLTAQSANKNIMTQVDAIVAKIAEEDGLTAVFHKQIVVFSKGMVDITEKVLKTLDELADDQKPEAPPAKPEKPKSKDKK